MCEHYIQKIFIPERVGNLYEVVAVCDVDIEKSAYVANIFPAKLIIVFMSLLGRKIWS